MNYGMGKQPNINGKVAKERLEPKWTTLAKQLMKREITTMTKPNI